MNSKRQLRRKSRRLKGYDYSQPGDYFITTCTHKRLCVLGTSRAMAFHPSKIGQVVQRCWDEISEHFPNARARVLQIMPNHIHGIISITPQIGPVGTRHAVSLQRFTGEKFGMPRRGSLSTIIRSFKSAVTNSVHRAGLFTEKMFWQSRFYDHVIRDNISYFFIERYIKLNPVLWHLDIENPLVLDDEKNLQQLRHHLLRNLDLDPLAVEHVIANEIKYRVWRRKNS